MVRRSAPSVLAVLVLTLAGCKEGEVIDPGFTNPQEMIPRVVPELVEFNAQGGATGDTIAVSGTNPNTSGTVPVVDALWLTNLHLYEWTIELLNERNGANITQEVCRGGRLAPVVLFVILRRSCTRDYRSRDRSRAGLC